ncbi:MAG: hypothetical protein OXU79_15695 [Gemmatimonadota bacterium]|nr:hypothetical protein [Gemmatimonadota bacterium]
MSRPGSRIERIRTWCAHAFAVNPPENRITEEERALAARMAEFVVRRQMTTPALMVLEAGRPFNFIGSQFLAFLSPFVTLIFSGVEYGRFVRFLEKRQSVQTLIDTLVETENRLNG